MKASFELHHRFDRDRHRLVVHLQIGFRHLNVHHLNEHYD
jgi:hypothetical protein